MSLLAHTVTTLLDSVDLTIERSHIFLLAKLQALHHFHDIQTFADHYHATLRLLALFGLI